MLRSYSKKAIENIKKYILDNYDPENYNLPIAIDFEEAARQIVSIFYREYAHVPCNRKFGYQSCFVDYCQGLPSIIDTCYYYNRSAVDDLGMILEETEAEKARFDECKAEQMLTKLIWRELFKACKYQVKDFITGEDEISERFIETVSRNGSASVSG